MSLLDNINLLNTWAGYCSGLLSDLEDDLDDRSITTFNLTQHGGIGYVCIANRAVLHDLIEAMQYFVYGQVNVFNYTKWFYVHKGLYDKEAEITWKSICEAWVKNDFEGRFWTIGIIDRMRQILWNEPFDLTWAARPEQREM